MTSLLPPPEDGTFASRADLYDFLQAHAMSQGYAITTTYSKEKKVAYQCDRGGKMRNNPKVSDVKRQRRTPSRRGDCKFVVHGKLTTEGWVLKVVHGDHNHEASNDMLHHPIARRLKPKDVERVLELLKTNSSPKFVAAVMRAENHVTEPRDISNIKVAEKKKMRAS